MAIQWKMKVALEEHIYFQMQPFKYIKWLVTMKQKFTITVDAELLPIAKRHARARGQSLSSLIEQCLKETIGKPNPSFAARWRGGFRAAERDDPRYDALAGKYLR